MRNVNFTAIDFELANSKYTSACAIGIVRVENGEIVSKKVYYIKPFPNYFGSFQKSLHGINEFVVSSAPTFLDLYPQIQHLIENQVIVCHNISFDKNVLDHLLDHIGVKSQYENFICSLYMSRFWFPNRPSYRLNILSSELLNKTIVHHNPIQDALACAELTLMILKKSDAPDFLSFIEALYVEKKRRRNSSGKIDLSKLKPAYDELINTTFKGKRVCVSGKIGTMTKFEVLQYVVDRGGEPHLNVTKSTNCLILGRAQEHHYKANPDFKTSKHQKALDYKMAGKKIDFITEDELYKMINAETDL